MPHFFVVFELQTARWRCCNTPLPKFTVVRLLLIQEKIRHPFHPITGLLFTFALLWVLHGHVQKWPLDLGSESGGGRGGRLCRGILVWSQTHDELSQRVIGRQCFLLRSLLLFGEQSEDCGQRQVGFCLSRELNGRAARLNTNLIYFDWTLDIMNITQKMYCQFILVRTLTFKVIV